MSRSLIRSLCRVASLLRAPKQSQARKPDRGALTLERLEDREVPAGLDYTSLVQSLGGYPVAGPTHLFLNFDGNGSNVAAFTGTAQDIQEVLYRTSEIFAPFDVEVSRLSGVNNFYNGTAGNTTIFIGANAANVARVTDAVGNVTVVKQTAGSTPLQYSDYPGLVKGSDHRPNSDPYDIAFVDPTFGPNTNPATWTNESDTAISEAIAHEAGHTFGLAHVRTDKNNGTGPFLLDPTPLPTPFVPATATTPAVLPSANQGTVSDIMSYTDPNQFFANTTLPVTAFNFTGTQTVIQPSAQPTWATSEILGIVLTTSPITTQNSFTYLRTVLGARPSDGEFHASDAFALDPSARAVEIPSMDTLATATTLSSEVSRPGDFNVLRYTTTAFQQQLQVDLVPTGTTLNPSLQVYDSFGNRVASVASVVNPATGLSEIHTTLGVGTINPGSTYYFVVGGRDGLSQGTFNLTVSGRLPVAQNHSSAAFLNTTLDVAAPGLQSGDTDPDHNVMTTVLVRGPSHGTLTYLNGNGSFEYVPALNYIGPDSFTYQERDLNGLSNVATVQLTVNPHPLSAPPLTYRVVSNQTLTTTTVNGILANFVDPNGRTPSVHLGSVHTAHGALSLNADGTFSYQPDAGFRGTDTFQYFLTDGLVTSQVATVTLIVGQPPVAADLNFSINAGSTLIVSVPNGLVGANGDTGGVAHFGGWVSGSPTNARALTLNADGSFTFYAPAGIPNEVATFEYYITNPDGTSSIGYVDITIHGSGFLPPPGKFPPQPPAPKPPL